MLCLDITSLPSTPENKFISLLTLLSDSSSLGESH